MRWTATGLNSVSLDEAAEERCALDLERVVCRLTELERQGARAFTIGAGDWPLRGFVVRAGDAVRGYVNRCPHAGHPLNLLPERFLTADGALILCSSHGALLDRKSTRLNSSHGYISYAVFCLKKKRSRKAARRSLTASK